MPTKHVLLSIRRSPSADLWMDQSSREHDHQSRKNDCLAIGSLTQPLFYRGANIARLKIAKAQQAEAMLSFEQAILNAGADVSDALSLYQSAEDKRIQRVKQINSLEKSVEYTQELLTLGTSNTNYLEVLTAQQIAVKRSVVRNFR